MKAKAPYIDPIALTKAVFYDPLTGVFRRNKAAPRSPSGSVLGIPNDKGYLRFDVLGHSAIMAHRLAWYYCYGRWPHGQIDHINGCRSDNRIENLRDVEEWVNHVNFHNRKPGKLGVLGVVARGKRFVGHVKLKGKKYETRGYLTVLEAKAARDALALELHGEFARL